MLLGLPPLLTLHGETPLIALVRFKSGDAAARLQVLLACPELDLDAKYAGKTADPDASDGVCSVLLGLLPLLPFQFANTNDRCAPTLGCYFKEG